MKKFICLFSALVLLVSMSVSALAADFVPSISYKDGPTFTEAWLDEEDVSNCLVITSIKQAQEKSTDITQEERDLLLKVYDELKTGDFTKEYVIRDLIDLNFKYNACRRVHFVEKGQPQSGSETETEAVTEAATEEVTEEATEAVTEETTEETQETETTEETQETEAITEETPETWTKLDELNNTDKNLTVKFNLGVSADTELLVKTYNDGTWSDIKSVVNNGDGTVTCEFEHLCPVLFAVKNPQGSTIPPKTGDTSGKYMPLWIGTMAVSGVALVALVVVALKKKAK